MATLVSKGQGTWHFPLASNSHWWRVFRPPRGITLTWARFSRAHFLSLRLVPTVKAPEIHGRRAAFGTIGYSSLILELFTRHWNATRASKVTRHLPEGQRGSPCSLNFWQSPSYFCHVSKYQLNVPCLFRGGHSSWSSESRSHSLRSLQPGTHSCQLLPADETQNPRQVLEGQWGEKQEQANRLFMTKPFSQWWCLSVWKFSELNSALWLSSRPVFFQEDLLFNKKRVLIYIAPDWLTHRNLD